MNANKSLWHAEQKLQKSEQQRQRLASVLRDVVSLARERGVRISPKMAGDIRSVLSREETR